MQDVHTNYRSYNSATPVQSKLLAYKWDRIKYNVHRNRLTTVKKQIDNSVPFTLKLKEEDDFRGPNGITKIKASNANYKKSQQDKIDKENERLHSKMVEIDQKGSGSKSLRSKSRNSNQSSQNTYVAPKRFSSFKNHQYFTEMQRVTKENQRLLNKIVLNEPIYNSKVFEKDFDVNHSRFVNNISKFPQQQQAKKPVRPKNIKSAGQKSLLAELENAD